MELALRPLAPNHEADRSPILPCRNALLDREIEFGESMPFLRMWIVCPRFAENKETSKLLQVRAQSRGLGTVPAPSLRIFMGL
jgi:hypothetical protein